MMLSSLAIDSVQKWQKDIRSPNVGLAYFYFSREVPSPLGNVALAILEQLHLQYPTPSTDKDVTELEVLAAKAERIPFPHVVSAIAAVSQQFERVYIIIDALDECSPEHLDDLVYLLASIKNSPARLLAFSTSHQTLNIFNDSPSIQIIPSKQDILLYAQSGLQSLPVGCEYLRATIIANLLEIGKQHSMFRPIVLQLRDVLSRSTPEDITQALETVPRGLNAAYQAIFEQILAQDPHIVKVAQRTLIWVYCSLRPLQIAEIIEVHRHNLTEVEVDPPLLITSCMGLLEHSESKIRFVHQSVPEFIKGANIGDEKNVAFQCLSYIISIKVSAVTDSEGVNYLIQSHPLLDYAANYWGHHLRKVIDKSNNGLGTLENACLKLLNDKPKVALLCHIVFVPRPNLKNRAVSNGLFKSSWLHLAAYFGLNYAIDSLSQYLGSATKCDEWGRTALHIAADQGFDDCVRSLLTKTSPNQQDVDGRTAWHYAAMRGNSRSMSHLLKWQSAALGPNRLIPATSLGADEAGKGKSPLEYAAVNGDAEMVRTLLPLYTDGSDNSIVGGPFLANTMFLAAGSGKIEILEYILSRNQTPHYEHLLAATKGAFEDIVRLLLEYGVEVTNPVENGDSAIVLAACNARNKILQLLIWNTLLEGTTKEINSALLSAVKVGNTEGVRILLRAGASPNASVDGTDEPIVYAARNGMTDMVRILCSSGPETSHAASVAVATGNAKILKLLLDSGKPNLETVQSLIEKARGTGHTRIVQLLMESYDFSPAEKPIPPDNVVKMQTHKEKRTPSDAEAAPLDELSQMPVPTQLETSSPPKPPSEINISITEPTEQHNSKSDTDHKALDSTTTKPTSPMPSFPGNNEPPTPGPYWKSTSSPPTEQGLAGVPASAGNLVPFLLLSEPIVVGYIGLGSVVAAPRDPLSGYAPNNLSSFRQATDNFISVSGHHNFTSMNYRESTSSFAFGVFPPILPHKSTPSWLVNIRASQVLRQRLHNHEQVLNQIYGNTQLADEIEVMMRATGRKEKRKELFFVVGLLVATDLRTTTSDSGTRSEPYEVKYEGERILAISYRSMKAQTRHMRFNRTSNASSESGFYLGNYFSPEAHERLRTLPP